MKFSPVKYKCGGSIMLLPCNIIKPNPNQPRKSFDKNELDSLASSIKNSGIIQPLVVRKTENGSYELISGERRLKAACIVGLQTVPCILMNVSECDSAVYSLIENLQRHNLNFFEEAEAFNRLITVYDLSQDELSQKLGKSQSSISNKIRLLKLPSDVRDIITENGLTERHARALIRIDNTDLLFKALNHIIIKNLNVNETDSYIDSLVSPVAARSKPKFKKLKDIKIFINTINHAVDTMRKAGINALSSEHETPDYYEYVVRIPKTATSPAGSCKAV